MPIPKGPELNPAFLEKLRILCQGIHHGSVTLHLNGERNSVDIEVNTRERVSLDSL